MDLDIEEEPQFSKMSSPEHHQFAGMDTETETETETEMSQVCFCIVLENVRLTAWVQISFFFSHKCFDSHYRTGQSGNLRTEPKFIVFLSKLLLLFYICPACKSEKPFVEISTLGSMVEVTMQCHNPDCPSPRNTWQSQPQMRGTRMPVGNFLLCFSVCQVPLFQKSCKYSKTWDYHALT